MVLKFLSWLRDNAHNAQGVWMNRINFEKATRQREQRARGGGLDIFELATRQRARGVDGLKILSWLRDNAHNATTRKGGCRGEILKLDLWFN